MEEQAIASSAVCAFAFWAHWENCINSSGVREKAPYQDTLPAWNSFHVELEEMPSKYWSSKAASTPLGRSLAPACLPVFDSHDFSLLAT